ncbi:ATP-binding protein [Lysobacter sp. CFH 32150]|uniref:ATP-binding protein n=1 Tax=Lysobacter sp. CFH 32150 TaxID=2927128 RepID=UPI001FA78FC4|nr:ATP-binding protein [Lysobacter sp. CFH 32150]
MKFSIAYRLFVAVLLSVMAVAAVGLEVVRWQLFDSSGAFADSGKTESVDRERLHDLGDALSAQFRTHHDWSFLPPNATRRQTWLRETLLGVPTARQAAQGDRWFSSNLGDRIGLLDHDKHYLAGAVANRLVIAFASIDTIQQRLVVDGRTVGYLVMAKTQSPADELAVAFLLQQQHNLMVVVGIGVLLSALAAAVLAAHFRRPIARLVAGARRLEAGRFDTRLGIHRSDELGELADTFDHLAARLANTERSRRQWVADTSHELRTPLSVLRGQLEALQDGVRTATPENVAMMLRQVLSLGRRVDELYELARADAGQMHYDQTPNAIWPLVVDTAASFAEKFRVAGLVASVGPPPLRSLVRCDAERIRQVVTNLLENCVRYTAAGGRIDLHGKVVGDTLHVTIDDSAPGVPESAMGRLGERFFRADSPRSDALGGAGLGLALCRQILDAHGGRLEFGASPLGGLRARIVLTLEDTLLEAPP